MSQDFYRTISLWAKEPADLVSDRQVIVDQLRGHARDFRVIDQGQTCLFLVRHRAYLTQIALLNAAVHLKQRLSTGNDVFLHVHSTGTPESHARLKVTRAEGLPYVDPERFHVGVWEMAEGSAPNQGRPPIDLVLKNRKRADPEFEQATEAALIESQRSLMLARMGWEDQEFDALWCPCGKLADYRAEPCGCKELCATCYPRFDGDEDLRPTCAKCGKEVGVRRVISDRLAPLWEIPLDDDEDVAMEDADFSEVDDEVEQWETEMWEMDDE
jgi:hypothetical protein